MATINKRTKTGPDGKPYIRWVARWRDSTGKQRSKVFDRKGAAEQYLATQVVSLATNTYVDPSAGKVSLDAFYREWGQRQVWAGGTRRAVDLAVADFPYSSLPLKNLRRSHVEQYVSDALARGLAASTVRQRVTNVRSVLRAAVRDRLIAHDPSEGVRLPRTANGSTLTIPTPQDVGALLDASRGQWRVAVALGAFAGLRLGEVLGLRAEDVDWTRRIIKVRRQGDDNGGTMPVKTRSSERDVPVPDGLLTLLSQHVPADGGYFVRGESGTAHRSTASTTWLRSMRRAGVSGFRFHDLRHFYASGLISAGCDVVTVQRAMGHAKASTTLGTYSHLWPNADDRTRQAASALVASALGAPLAHTGAQKVSDAEGS